MGYLNSLLEKVERLDVDDVIATVEAATNNSLEELQRDQLLHGLGPDGEKIGQYRNEHYAIIKHGMNPLPGFPFIDLKYSGDLYASITANIVGKELIVEFTDPRTIEKTELWAQHPDDLLGLDSEYRRIHINTNIRPVFNSTIQERTGLKFSK